MTLPPIILASASPRRRDFIKLLQTPFRICAADIDERNGENERPRDLVARLSRAKAVAVAARHPQAIVIGADTVVALGGDIMGKPAGAADAANMLVRLRDRAHHVYSGIAICSMARGLSLAATVDSQVWMRPYSDGEIDAYIDSGDPLDKAGAYGIQNAAFHPVARLRGCYAGVMGLPLCHLAALLRQAGVDISVNVRAACESSTGVACVWAPDERGGPNIQSMEIAFDEQNIA